MILRPPIKSDLQQVEALLQQSGLPYEGCREHLDNFLIVEVADKIIGVGGLELYGEVALLRSIAVLEEYRGQNIGDTIYTEIKAKARSLGVRHLYLFTETAESYFKRRNFSVIDRSSVPTKIRQTQQYLSLCPSSAIAMEYTF